MTGSSTQGIKTVLYPVSDLATAKAVYAALLGVPPQTDGSDYVGFKAASATVKEPVRDVGGGRLVATVTDPDGQRPRAPSGPIVRTPRSRPQRRRDIEHRLTQVTTEQSWRSRRGGGSLASGSTHQISQRGHLQ